MKLNTKGVLEIDLAEFVDRMSEDQLRELAKTAAFRDDVIEGIVSELVTGSTKDGWYHGSTDELRLKLAPLMGEVARRAIKMLIWDLGTARAISSRYEKGASELYDAWPEGYEQRRPHPGRLEGAPAPDDAGGDAALSAAEKQPCEEGTEATL